MIARALLALAVLLAFAAAPQVLARAPSPAIVEVAAAELPREARETVALIHKGGPFPHKRDGIVFGNREKQLPAQKRGYYREYTVKTPGATGRGARRIVAGSGGELYYTDDHYSSFRRVRE